MMKGDRSHVITIVNNTILTYGSPNYFGVIPSFYFNLDIGKFISCSYVNRNGDTSYMVGIL